MSDAVEYSAQYTTLTTYRFLEDVVQLRPVFLEISKARTLPAVMGLNNDAEHISVNGTDAPR